VVTPSAVNFTHAVLHLIWIVPLVLIIAFISSPRFRGDIAESRTRRVLANGLEKSRYTIFNDIILPAGGGTIHLDHVVVSRFGVFAIESQYARGRVSGGEFQDRWKEIHWGRTRRFDNPMHKNRVQAEVLGRLLNLPSAKIRPVVALTGQNSIEKGMPHNLVQVEKLIEFFRKQGTHVLEPDQAERLRKAVEDIRVHPRGPVNFSYRGLLIGALILILMMGIWLSFRQELLALFQTVSQNREMQQAPEFFHQDGSRKSQQEIWEDSLICARSEDTGRCACYEPGGDRVEIDEAQCRSLAERGSILKQ
jgi:restriction system protein